MKILKNSKIFEKLKIEKEIIMKKKVKRSREDACSTSYPSGNQVDGLPLVAIIPKQHEKERAGGPARRCTWPWKTCFWV